jgi:hypothetical protein
MWYKVKQKDKYGIDAFYTFSTITMVNEWIEKYKKDGDLVVFRYPMDYSDKGGICIGVVGKEESYVWPDGRS